MTEGLSAAQQLRLDCLKLAVSYDADTDQAIRLADTYFNFVVKGRTETFPSIDPFFARVG